MAKPKKNIGKQPQGHNNTVNHSTDKAELEKKIPTWSASFENASKIYKACGQELEINIDQSQLENVVKNISEEGAKTVSDWVNQFAKL